MELRDRFAAHFAAALVDAFADPAQIAQRAYDLADAMMAERERRIDVEEEAAIAAQPGLLDLPEPEVFADDDDDAMVTLEAPPPFRHAALLDDPAPMSELERDDDEALPSWLDPPYDPRWDLDARWSASGEEPPRRASDRPPGPGLARTQPDAAAEERPARSGRTG